MAARKCTFAPAAVMGSAKCPLGTSTLVTICLVLMANSVFVEPKTLDQIQLMSFLVDGPITLECPLVSRSDPDDDIKIVFWYKGFNQKAFMTLDNRLSSVSLNPSKNPVPKVAYYPPYPIDFSNIYDGDMVRLASAQRRLNEGDDLKNLGPNGSSFDINFTNALVDKEGKPIRIQSTVEKGVAKLMIMDAKLADEGQYRCRVDFVRSRTETHYFKVELIVPPKNLIIRDVTRNNVVLPNGKLKTPFDEDTENVILTCQTEFVKPAPSVLWYEGNILVDDSFEIYKSKKMRNSHHQLNRNISVDPKIVHRKRHQESFEQSNSVVQSNHQFVQVRNQLIIRGRLARRDVGRTFRCVAYNVNWIPLFEVNVTLDIYLRPISVIIEIGSEDAFVAGRDVGLLCYSHGARPLAQLAWYKDGKLMSDRVEGHYDAPKNMSSSVIRWTATAADHGAEVVCQARNIYIKSEIGVLNDSVKLNVKFAPIVNLITCDAHYLNNESEILVKNSTIQLYCDVHANPPANGTIIWRYNETIINSNLRHGITIHNRTMGITNLNHSIHDGSYSCYAQNSYGAAVSNTINVSVSFAPICEPNQKTEYRVGVNQSVDILCNIRANPPIAYFHFKLNASKEMGSFRQATRGNVSWIKYQPMHRYDYGQVYCYAKNAVGEIEKPCVFEVVPYGVLEPVQKCVVLQNLNDQQLNNATFTQTVESESKANETHPVMIHCKFNYNGGSHTGCRAEMYRANDSVLAWSGNSEPEKKKYGFPNIDCIIKPTSLVVTSLSTFRLVVVTFNEIGSAKEAFEFYAKIEPTKDSKPQTNLAQKQRKQGLEVYVTKVKNETKEEIDEYGELQPLITFYMIILTIFLTAAALYVLCKIFIVWKLRQNNSVYSETNVNARKQHSSIRGSVLANPGNLEQMTSFMNGPEPSPSMLRDSKYWHSSYGIMNPDLDIFQPNQSEQDNQQEQLYEEVPIRSDSLTPAGASGANLCIYSSCDYESIYPPPPVPFNQQSQTEVKRTMPSNYGSFLNRQTTPESNPNAQARTNAINYKQGKCELIEMATYQVEPAEDPYSHRADYHEEEEETDTDPFGPGPGPYIRRQQRRARARAQARAQGEQAQPRRYWLWNKSPKSEQGH